MAVKGMLCLTVTLKGGFHFTAGGSHTAQKEPASEFLLLVIHTLYGDGVK